MRNGRMPKNIVGNCRIAAYWERVTTGNMAKRSYNAYWVRCLNGVAEAQPHRPRSCGMKGLWQ